MVKVEYSFFASEVGGGGQVAAMLMVIILLNLTGNGYPVIRLDTMSSSFSRVKTIIKSE